MRIFTFKEFCLEFAILGIMMVQIYCSLIKEQEECKIVTGQVEETGLNVFGKE
jgi:hypothetical protein